MDAITITEKRKGERVTVRDLRVVSRDTGELVGTLVNLSFGGMLINSAAPFEANNSYKFRIPFDKRFLGEDNFDVDAECVWCNNDVNPEIYSVGFKFPFESADQIIFLDQIHSKFRKNH